MRLNSLGPVVLLLTARLWQIAEHASARRLAGALPCGTARGTGHGVGGPVVISIVHDNLKGTPKHILGCAVGGRYRNFSFFFFSFSRRPLRTRSWRSAAEAYPPPPTLSPSQLDFQDVSRKEPKSSFATLERHMNTDRNGTETAPTTSQKNKRSRPARPGASPGRPGSIPVRWVHSCLLVDIMPVASYFTLDSLARTWRLDESI